MHTAKLVWKDNIEGVIWKIVPSASEPVFMVESKDQDQSYASRFNVNGMSQRGILKFKSQSTLGYFDQNQVAVQHLDTREQGQIMMSEIIDLDTGKEIDGFSGAVIYLDENVAISYQDGAYFEWDRRSRQKREITGELKPPVSDEFRFPRYYFPESDHFKTCALFLQSAGLAQIQGGLDYLESERGLYLGGRYNNEKKVAKFLIKVNLEGRIEWKLEAKLANAAEQAYSFFELEGKIIAITDQKTIAAYE